MLAQGPSGRPPPGKPPTGQTGTGDPLHGGSALLACESWGNRAASGI